ncbi:hypothetical protein [Sphingomonas alba]|uniref:Uncharacterized protein n=1 Tax=Sphingomonas alba TaxID=2908208 RepID=A0ABT0RJE2_9SPHN|nr:hypothetical protein [Sphingomonas alba]MCL6682720.1 hypothetical protein [Sphingomonas alba]
MSVRVPTPLHGWRAFIGEVGVIVLGVLLALGAQQLVQDVQMRSAVREFRRTINHEIGLNLFVYQVRTRGSDCNEKRLKELTDWVMSARDGQSLPKIIAAAPMTLSPYRSAWDTRDGDVFAHVPAKDRQKYAEFYDELESNSLIIQKELDEWLQLQRFALPGPVSLEDRRMLYGHVRTARIFNRVWAPNMDISNKIAAELGVKSIKPDTVSDELLKQVAVCQPTFEQPEGKDVAVGSAARS